MSCFVLESNVFAQSATGLVLPTPTATRLRVETTAPATSMRRMTTVRPGFTRTRLPLRATPVARQRINQRLGQRQFQSSGGMGEALSGGGGLADFGGQQNQLGSGPAVQFLQQYLGQGSDENSISEANYSQNGFCINGSCGRGIRTASRGGISRIERQSVAGQSSNQRLRTRGRGGLFTQFQPDSSASYRANRLMQAAIYQANRCRSTAEHKLLGRAVVCGIENSKGMCAQAVRQAFGDAGMALVPGHGGAQGPNLRRLGFSQVAYNPESLPGGSVLVCQGGGTRYGHIEIVVTDGTGRRQYCSDFCSLRPTCSNGTYRSMQAYTLRGL